jgi:hypothetical protein
MNLKKIFTGALVLAATSSFIFAISDTNAKGINNVPSPSSMTFKATSGTFSTDVDKYINIKNWSAVDLTKGFFFLDYGFQGNRFNAGYATKLAGNYLGLYFGGNGGDFDLINQSYSDENKGNATNSFNGNGTSYTASALFGFANSMAIKASMFYNPTTVTRSTVKAVKTTDGTIDIKNNVDIYNLNTDLTFGFGKLVSIKGKEDKVILSDLSVSLGLDTYQAKNTTRIGYADSSFSDVYVRSGATLFDWNMQLDTRWRLYPKYIYEEHLKSGNTTTTVKTQTIGASDNLISLTASRAFKYKPMEKLTLVAKPVVPMHVGFLSTQYGSQTGTADWVYSLSNKNETDIVFVPALNLGAQFNIAPGKVDFNCGTNLGLGTLGWNIVKTSYRKDTDTKAAAWSDTVVDFGWDSKNLNISWKSGFTVHFGPLVTLDLDYNLLGTLIPSNMTTSNGSGWVSNASPFWGSIENLFVKNTNLSMQLSVKF